MICFGNSFRFIRKWITILGNEYGISFGCHFSQNVLLSFSCCLFDVYPRYATLHFALVLFTKTPAFHGICVEKQTKHLFYDEAFIRLKCNLAATLLLSPSPNRSALSGSGWYFSAAKNKFSFGSRYNFSLSFNFISFFFAI